MSVTPNDLRRIPLFSDISEPHLAELLSSLTKTSFPKGHVLFKEGDMPKTFLLLVKGRVRLTEESTTRFVLDPVAPIGRWLRVMGLMRRLPRRGRAGRR